MAHQPKKYIKFVATAATATLVASAIIPVASAASFTDVAETNSHAANIDALVEAGIIKGFEDGTFKPGQTLTRGHVVKMLGKWVEAQGFEVPADYATKARFTDVAVDSNDQELVKYAALVADYGVFNGSNGALNAKGNITRENMALTLDRAYKAVFGATLVELAADTENLVVADLATAKAEAREVIQALRNLEISVVENFDPKASVTRGQFASFLNKTISVEAPAVELTVKSAVAKTTTTLEVVLSDDSQHVVTLPTALEANEATEVKFTIDEKEYTATVTFEVATPSVVSVEAVNGVTIKVKFSEAVSSKEEDYKGKVTVGSLEITKEELSENGKTLTLTSKNVIDTEKATVVVDAIKTAKNPLVKTEKYVSVLTYKDIVLPTITSVAATTAGKTATSATITVSEPIKTGALAKIDGTYYKVDFNGTNQATIAGLSLDAAKSHTLELINMEDIAGNKVISATQAFNVTVDATAPTATLSVEGDSVIKVTFNKAMDSNAAITALTGVVKDELLGEVTTGPVTEVTGSKGTAFLIPVTNNAIFKDKDSRTFTVVLKDTLVDSLGNKVAASTQSVTLTKDSAKPVATGYTVVRGANNKVTAIEVNFSEGLTAAAANSIAFGTVVTSEGVLDATTFAKFKNEAVKLGDKKVVFAVADADAVEMSGVYNVTFAKELVSDLAATPNKADSFKFAIDLGTAETTNEFKLAENAVEVTGNVIKVTFPEAVKGGNVANSVTDASNYTLGGLPLADGTTITLNADKTVATITLPTASSIKADDEAAIFTVANVQNTAGTKTAKSFAKTVAVTDNTAPNLVAAQVVDNKTIELTYDEAIKVSDLNVNDEFLITVGNGELTLAEGELTATAVSGFDKKVRITLAKGTDKAAVEAKDAVKATVTVTGKATGTVVETSETVVTDKEVTLTDAHITAKKVVEGDVTLTLADDAVAGEVIKFTTTAAIPAVEAKPASTATVLDLKEVITIKTLASEAAGIIDASKGKNAHAAGIKLTVASKN